jgi:hypothetical protein
MPPCALGVNLGKGRSIMITAALVAALAAAEIVVVIWAITDAATRPRAAWKRAGQNKVLWIALQPLGLVFVVGLAIPVVYFLWIRPSVKRAEVANDVGIAAGQATTWRPTPLMPE